MNNFIKKYFHKTCNFDEIECNNLIQFDVHTNTFVRHCKFICSKCGKYKYGWTELTHSEADELIESGECTLIELCDYNLRDLVFKDFKGNHYIWNKDCSIRLI